MDKLEQAARQALEAGAFRNYFDYGVEGFAFVDDETLERFAALVAEPWIETNKALAKEIIEMKKQADQEPVAYHVTSGRRVSDGMQVVFNEHEILYAAPVRTKDLTDEEVWEALHDKGLMEGIRAVIAADRSKSK